MDISGDLYTVSKAYKADQQTVEDASLIIFSTKKGEQVDINVTGTEPDFQQRYRLDESQAKAEPITIIVTEKKRGRPKLGVDALCRACF